MNCDGCVHYIWCYDLCKKYHCTVDMADCDGPELPIEKEEKERQD